MENTEGLVTETTETTEQTVKTYTEAEVAEMLQKEGDRRVTSALKKQQAQFETKLAEAEKLRGMDEAQRREYEFNQKVAELEKREKEFNMAQNKLEAIKVLANRDMPAEFVDYIVAEDADTMMEAINQFERLWKAAVSDAVSKKIASKTPNNGSVVQTGITKEAFNKMSIAQQTEIFNTNPNLYNQLIK